MTSPREQGSTDAFAYFLLFTLSPPPWDMWSDLLKWTYLFSYLKAESISVNEAADLLTFVINMEKKYEF